MATTTPAGAKPARSAAVVGSLWMLGAVASFVSMAVAGRELSGSMSVEAILFWRSLVGLLCMIPIVWRDGGPRAFMTSRPGGHLWRNIVHFTGQFGWFYGIVHVPLALMTSFSMTLPFWGAILAAIFLKERLGGGRLAMILIGFLGVLVIVQPGVAPVNHAVFVGLGGIFCYAASAIMVKVLSRTESANSIVFWMMVMQTPMALALAWNQLAWPSLADLPWVVLVGVTGVTAHSCLTRALSKADAAVVLPVNFVQLPIMALIGILAYGEVLDPWTVAGAALILAANWWNVRREARKAAAAKP